MLLERVVVEVLVAVREVRAVTRDSAPGPARSFWIRILPFFEPKPPATQSSLASRPTRMVGGEVPRLHRQVLQGDVFELCRLLDEELGDRVRVAREPGDALVYLDQRRLRALLGDDEQAEEHCGIVGGVRHAHVERLLDDDAFEDDDEQAVTERRVVRGELLVPADQLVETRMVVEQRFERDAVRRALDLDSTLVHDGHAHDVDVEHRHVWGQTLDMALRAVPVGVEALEVGEAPGPRPTSSAAAARGSARAAQPCPRFSSPRSGGAG